MTMGTLVGGSLILLALVLGTLGYFTVRLIGSVFILIQNQYRLIDHLHRRLLALEETVKVLLADRTLD